MNHYKKRIYDADYGHGDVYIQDVDGMLWSVGDWDNGAIANAIAVMTPWHSFLIALRPDKMMRVDDTFSGFWRDRLMYTTNPIAAKCDYDGKRNTMLMTEIEPSQDFSAGYCAAYTFPDGVTRGHLPSLGELYIAYKNKDAINAALKACGVEYMMGGDLQSSTFHEPEYAFCYFWLIDFDSGSLCKGVVDHYNSVRVFGQLNQCNNNNRR